MFSKTINTKNQQNQKVLHFIFFYIVLVFIYKKYLHIIFLLKTIVKYRIYPNKRRGRLLTQRPPRGGGYSRGRRLFGGGA